MQDIKKPGIKMICPLCTHKWVYRGKNKVKTTCPDCMRKVNIVQNKPNK